VLYVWRVLFVDVVSCVLCVLVACLRVRSVCEGKG
jgi:hypothetical protein